ncbi:hypothetical protein QYE76_006022 [Lolium multiflorum]|uniref:Aminotransferase-like plant mobile domain-containing protein n=1 Tax=Lolium multiflorum TaxID=4521 RepID=A0AAD8RVZ0_LOLMU|nr:hypothetical protein QYE76_006022 [Lolium multiflorum]
MNAAALTALVDRWRPETHTFHLRAGEMTPTLQDVSMILGLPIQGEPLCMNTASDGWRGQMEDLIGMAPPEPANPKERAPAGASFLGSGLTLENARQDIHPSVLVLDEACRRIGSGGIGGCLLLLSVWSWDRLSVGRPRILNERPWPHYRNNPDREPTWAYLWDNVSEMTSDPMVMYRHYTEELDTLTAEQVDWEPYGTFYRIGAVMTDLNPKCTEESHFWRMRCPLICMWLVEYHQPHRVMRRFGLYQECPPQWQDTDHALHSLDDPIEFDEVAQSQHDTFARRGRSTSIASSLNFVRSEIQKTADECEVVWDQSHRDEKPIGPMRYFIKNTARKMRRLANLLGCREGEIAGIEATSKQRSAYQLKPRGKAPNRYTPDDYVNRGKKVVIEPDEEPPRGSALRRMRNDEPSSSEKEVEEEAPPPPPPRRKQPAMRGRKS